MIKLGAPHKFENEEINAIILNAECSGNNDIKVIWYSDGNIFELMPGFQSGQSMPDDSTGRKKSFLKNKYNKMQSKKSK